MWARVFNPWLLCRGTTFAHIVSGSHRGECAAGRLRPGPEEPNCDAVGRAGGRTIRPEAFRKQVSRARRLFAEPIVAETSRTLGDPTPLKVEDELIDIGVMKYVRPYLPGDWRTSGKLTDPE